MTEEEFVFDINRLLDAIGIDHRVNSLRDCLDLFTGVTYGMNTRREQLEAYHDAVKILHNGYDEFVRLSLDECDMIFLEVSTAIVDESKHADFVRKMYNAFIQKRRARPKYESNVDAFKILIDKLKNYEKEKYNELNNDGIPTKPIYFKNK